ncbi:hypothetical protein [Sphingomonas immobilis]|uniref:PH domain-containing protein n=1 Tax=Sphingomonas immobilis TaxID=3063997 RepID=A0ABT9A0E7_9SPHN|nr:hypothetical protein [Sphingomonas sp. CA1-15]MDO7843297.1 hypothetical protein [Sphingomonas sp. CA1-15]
MAGTFGKRGIVGEAPAAQRGLAPVQPAPARAESGGQRFDYRPKIGASLLAAGFFTLMAVGMVWIAQTNDRGLVLYHLIRFDRDGATVFYWCLVGFFALAACYGAYGVQLAFSDPREVVVGKAGITAPAGAMSSKTVTVRYTSITHVAMVQQGKYHFFHIHHQDGKLSIPKSMIADDDTFERMLAAIENGMMAAAQARV